ncbi:hypothetical protein [Bacillus safensis]|uniref:hypothetical protein n=1 Tax=Bacillus safensis TaxID=561879 RepID=UPI0023EA3A34|nr:hypothetical protein [Bacillus safensis]GLF90760.1 hypothetical protein Saga11_20190 [Bacillus safensis]
MFASVEDIAHNYSSPADFAVSMKEIFMKKTSMTKNRRHDAWDWISLIAKLIGPTVTSMILEED